MKPTTVDVTLENAYGKPLPSPVKFSFAFDAYESKGEIKAEDLLDEDEYVSAVNARRKAKIRAKETTKALDAAGIAKPDMNAPENLVEQQVKIFMKLNPGMTEEIARQVVAVAQKTAESLRQPA